MPYGFNVLVPSYLAFFETVAACLVTAFLIDPHERSMTVAGWLHFAVTVMLVRGTIIAMFVIGPMIGNDPAAGLLSMSQFFFQDLTMVILTYLVARAATGCCRC